MADAERRQQRQEPGAGRNQGTDTTNRTPPPNISALRSQTSPRTPTAGSNTWPTTAGIASSTPICAYVRPMSVRIRGQAASRAPYTSSSSSATARKARSVRLTLERLRACQYQGMLKAPSPAWQRVYNTRTDARVPLGICRLFWSPHPPIPTVNSLLILL